MSETKYNYKKAIELIREKFNLDKKISYVELESVLGLRSPIGGKNSSVNSAIQHLKGKLAIYGLAIKSANTRAKTENKWYDIYPLVESVKADVKVERGDISNAMQALEKDNQKLFLQNEELQQECNELRQACERFAEKETEYKKIIASFYSLAMA